MSQTLINRVPPIIFSYWIIKIASTTLGETGADMFSMTYDVGYAMTSVIFLSIFLALLTVKLLMKRYDPIVYWLVFTSTSIVGTAISDFMDRTLGLGYALGSVILLTGLLCTLTAWYFKERSINVDHIHTKGAEVFYWIAFLWANTLGTAAGDFIADDLGLGFALGAIIIAGILVATALLHYFTRVSSVLLFWIAFVMTRPFGATFGDYLTKPVEKAGLDLGTVGSSAVFVVLLVVFVAYEHRRHKKTLLDN